MTKFNVKYRDKITTDPSELDMIYLLTAIGLSPGGRNMHPHYVKKSLED
jgi:hypothetical protein